MNDGPVVDGRPRERLLAELREVADSYAEEWDPYSEDSGTTVLKLFSRFEADVIQRLDSVPEKHRIAFLDALNFSRRPPQSARVPLTFETTEDVDGNVVVPGGTQAIAELGEDRTEIFEIPQEDGFEATAATVAAAYGVEPSTDRIFDHGTQLTAGEETTLFTGDDLQQHVLYLGHGDLLNVDAGSTVTVTLLTNVSEATLEEDLAWEYYGENEDEEEGWHPLPQETTDITQMFDDSEAGLEEIRQAVQERIQAFAGGGAEWGNTPFDLQFTMPGEVAEREVGGIESRWIRARARGEDESYLDLEVESVSLNVERGGDEEDDEGLVPRALQNDVPLSLDGDEDLYPYGRMPQPPTTLYVASEEAFTKRRATAEVRFDPPAEDEEEEADEDEADEEDDDARTTGYADAGLLSGDPEISWEYWDGNGWSRLPLIQDTTDDLREPGFVSFAVPDDLEETTVSGHDDHWIRARLVSGNYGQPRYEVTEEGGRGRQVDGPDPPVFGGITVHYDQKGQSFEDVLTYNNVSYREITTDERPRSFVPFEEIPDEKQTLYLGFDETLRDGPVNLHVPMGDDTYPRSFEPGMRWEYCHDPEHRRWSKLEVQDGTEGLTERGIVSINFPDDTEAFELFGEERHWIRVRVTRDEFAQKVIDLPTKRQGERTVEVSRADRTPVAGSETPPTVEGIYPNTQWAYNAETIEEEVLGSSDGTHEQSFTCDFSPVTEGVEVWVDEVTALSKKEQEELEEARPADVDRLPETGEAVEFWVRWTEVDSFLDSGDSSRHYTVDRTSGTVHFGDGQRGAIPPSGDDNVRATYKTGGGSEGNVDAGAIDDLRTPISLIESVTNLKPSDGGADVESMDAVARRAPQQIKNRNRAVSVRDFEQVAKTASRELAKVKCEPEMDERGRRSPGWVTLLVVPRERRERPTPSMELRDRVQAAVSEQAPATLVGPGNQRIVVRGPNYAEVGVRTTVRSRRVESVSNLKARIERSLDEYFHPLTGGRDGDGWSFAESPPFSGVTSLLESIDDVDEIAELVMTVTVRGEEKEVRDDRSAPTLPRDTLVCSGVHEVTVSMTGQR